MDPTLLDCDARVVRAVQIFCPVFVTEGMKGPTSLTSDAMTVQRQRLGRHAEELVAARLAAAGWEILERNARTRYGELDLVALDGDALVFAEVKAGSAASRVGPERPILAIDSRKQRRVRRLATAWLAERRRQPRYTDIRFDAFGVTYDRAGGIADLEHIRGAF
jgi:putative endonuclease